MGTFLLLWALSWRKSLDLIHSQSFHLFIQCFLHPWAGSACANAVYYLSFKGIMTHHPQFLLAASKVTPSPASHSLIGIQRLKENFLSALPGAFKEIFHGGRTFYHRLPMLTVYSYSTTKKQVMCQSKQDSVPCPRTLTKDIFVQEGDRYIDNFQFKCS